MKAALEKLGLGADVEHVTATIRQNYLGEDVLMLEVTLREQLAEAPPSLEGGKRIERIENALRDRAAKLGIPLFASIWYTAPSKRPRRIKKSA